jgi:hypothetical protein
MTTRHALIGSLYLFGALVGSTGCLPPSAAAGDPAPTTTSAPAAEKKPPTCPTPGDSRFEADLSHPCEDNFRLTLSACAASKEAALPLIQTQYDALKARCPQPPTTK